MSTTGNQASKYGKNRHHLLLDANDKRVEPNVPSILEMCFLTFPAQPWQWIATFITTTCIHTCSTSQ